MILLLFAFLAVSCEGGFGWLKDEVPMTEYYKAARTAFKLSTGVELPELEGVDLKDEPAGTYDTGIAILNDVIKSGGSHDYAFEFTSGVTYDVYSQSLVAIAKVFGQEYPGFPKTEDNYVFNCWCKDDLSVFISYKKDNTVLSFMVFEGHPTT